MPLPIPTQLPPVAYVAAGLFGLFSVIIGSSWFVAGKGAIVAGFPTNLAEAVAAIAGGAAVTIWALAKIARRPAAPTR